MSSTASDILAACPVFARVRGPGQQRLLNMAQVRSFSRNHQIARQDDPCPGVFIVGSGLVRIYKLAPSGKEHVLHLVGPRQMFLEVAAIAQMPCPAFAEAVEDSTCLLLPQEPFYRALHEDHALCLQLLAGMTMRVRQFVGLLEDIVLRDALSRVGRYLLTMSREQQGSIINLPSLKKHLASHLNLTSETLSRCLRQLTDEGLIETEGQSIRILDPQELEEVAEGLFPRI